MGDILSPINVDELTLAVKSLVGNACVSPPLSDDLDDQAETSKPSQFRQFNLTANASEKCRTSCSKPAQKRKKERKKAKGTVIKPKMDRNDVVVSSSQSATRLPCFLSMVPTAYLNAANKRQELSKSNILLPTQKVSSTGMLLIGLAKLVDSSENDTSSQPDDTTQTVPDTSVSRSATHTHEDILPESCLNNINTEDFIPVHSQQATQSDHDKDEQVEDFPPSAYSDQSQPVVSQTFNFDDYYHSCQMTDTVGSLSHQSHSSSHISDAVESLSHQSHSSCQLTDAVESLSHQPQMREAVESLSHQPQMRDAVESLSHQSHNSCQMGDAVDSLSHQSHLDHLSDEICNVTNSGNNPVAHSGSASTTVSPHDLIYSSMSHYASHSQVSRSQMCQEVYSAPSSVLSLLPTLCNPHSSQLIDTFGPSHHQAVDTSNTLLDLGNTSTETGRLQSGSTFLHMAQRSNVVNLPTLSNFDLSENINSSNAAMTDFEIPRDTTPYAALENLVMNAANHPNSALEQSASALAQNSLQNLHSQLDQSAAITLHETTNHVEVLPIQSSALCLPETANRSSFPNLSSLIHPVIGGCVWSPHHADSDSGISTDASAPSPNLSVIDFILKTHQSDLDLNRDSSQYAGQQHIPGSHYTNTACNGQFQGTYNQPSSQLHEASLNSATLGQPLQHVSTEYSASAQQNGHVTSDVILSEQTDSAVKERTYCVMCNATYLGPCKTHRLVYSHFEDTAILTRARASLPSMLYLKQSTISSNREGVYAHDQLDCYSQFGPLVGQYKPRGDYKLDGRVDEFVWKIYLEGEYELILTEDEQQSNWMRFVQQAKSEPDINVMAYQQEREIYFVTCRPIAPHQELCFWFGKEFASVMGVPLMPGHRARCALCNITFSTPKAVRQHVRNSHHSGETKILRCTMCEQAFKKTYELREHTLSHMGVQPHHCPECGKSFQSKSNLRKHVRRHRGLLNFACVLCNKVFTQKIHRDRHMVHHTGQKAFCCSYCTCQFARKSDMVAHENTHTHTVIYPCSQCGKNFYKHAAYKKHLKVHAAQRGFICEKCNRSFYRRYHLDRHMKTCRKTAPTKPGLFLDDAELDLDINRHAAAAAAAAAAATAGNDVNI